MKPFAKEVLEKKIRNLIEKKENFKDIDKKLKENDYTQAINLCEELMGSLPRNLSELMKLKGEILLKKGSIRKQLNFMKRFFLWVILFGASWAEGKLISCWANMKKQKKYLRR